MRKFRGFVRLAVLLFAFVGAVPASAAPLAPAASQTSAAPQAVSLIHKVTLWGETSIDGPALSSITDNFEGVHHITTIGWTGTDASHHLNLLQSSDNPALGALHFGTKLTLPDTSFARPAIYQFGGGIGTTAVAWTGTDPHHSLNLATFYSTGGVAQRWTFWHESSNFAPALAYFDNNLIVAWTGTDTNHSLNVLPINFSSKTVGTKTVLSQFSSSAGPNLSVYPLGTGDQLVLNWTTSTQHLNLATSTDGVHFTNALGATGTLQLSAQAPASLYVPSEGSPDFWMAWTGTDAVHHLNIQWTQHFPQWPNAATSKTVLADSAFGGPQITSNEGLILAWTGTDPGQGNATPLTLSGGNLTETLGANLGVGVYCVGIRAQDAAGNWSSTTTTMLVVYDASTSLRMTGKNKKDLVPTLANSDVLPGLISTMQIDSADFGFTVEYRNGVLDSRNDFMFTYTTGTNCGKPSAQNCHNFTLNANSFAWLILDQTNNSRGRFQGSASVTVDGVTTTNPFTVTGIDGDRLSPAANDSLVLKVYSPGADPSTATPIYQASGSMAQGNPVKIQ